MLRNCLKKGFRPAAVLVVAVLMCSLGGCSDSESGWLEGRAFTMNAYSNTGELTLTSHAEKIGLDGNVTTDSRYYGIGTNGSVSSGSTDSLSSVIRFWFAETLSFRTGRKQTVLLSQIDMI